MRSILAAVATAILLAAPVQASGNELIARITPEHLAKIVEEVTGKKPELGKNDAGDPIVSVNPGNGVDEYILGRCTAQGCLDIQATTFFDKNPKLTLAVVNSYNNKYLNAQGSIGADGLTYLIRLFVTDGGVSEENIKVNIKIFMDAPGALMEVVETQATASLPATGVPVAATRPSLLSRQPMRALPVKSDPQRARKLQ